MRDVFPVALPDLDWWSPAPWLSDPKPDFGSANEKEPRPVLE